MKKGDKVEFYLFSALEKGIVERVNRKNKTLNISLEGIIYPNVETFKELPKKAKDTPPWYILKS
tara:strand:- start:241 stop:432 length:192 start_codon:yes stop_codon:yes gene_type:complete